MKVICYCFVLYQQRPKILIPASQAQRFFAKYRMVQETTPNPLHDSKTITWSSLPRVKYTWGYSTKNESTSDFRMATGQVVDWKNFEADVRKFQFLFGFTGTNYPYPDGERDHSCRKRVWTYGLVWPERWSCYGRSVTVLRLTNPLCRLSSW